MPARRDGTTGDRATTGRREGRAGPTPKRGVANSTASGGPKVALVCSHGGHLTELMALSTAWDDMDHFWVTYDAPRTRALDRAYLLRNIGFNPFLMAKALLSIVRIFAIERPAVLITDGAEIAIPAVLVGRLLGCRIIFVEVWTRVSMPTMSGRIVYPFCHGFFVMWPEMLESYAPKAGYVGGLL